jgi:hypothetical protein
MVDLIGLQPAKNINSLKPAIVHSPLFCLQDSKAGSAANRN